MREINLGLYKGKKQSDIIYFTKEENIFSMHPFLSDISGLNLILKYPDGKKKNITIYETGVARTIENVSLFECFWFEYEKTDKDYFAQIVITP